MALTRRPSVPVQADFKAAPGAQTVNGSGWPSFRQCGEQIDFPAAALHQHFGNAGRPPKIAINLKGRARVKHIGVGPFRTDQGFQYFKCVIAFAQMPPKGRFATPSPNRWPCPLESPAISSLPWRVPACRAR